MTATVPPHRPVRERLAGSPPGLSVAVGVLLLVWWGGWAWRTVYATGSAVDGISWHFFADGGSWLVHTSGIHVYAQHPELQVGPLALLVSAVLQPLGAGAAKTVALTLMALAGPALVLALAPVTPGSRRRARLVIALLVLAPGWLNLAVRFGHLDDVLAMAGAVLAVRALHAGRAWATGAWLAFAIAAKPWAIGFVPLVLALPAGGAIAGLAVAVIGTCVAWLPFVLGDTGTLAALHPRVALVDHSGLHLLGARGQVVPAWGRTVQFLLTPAVAALAAIRHRWPGVLVIAVAVRIVLDAQDNAYYVGSAALAALVFDLIATRWLVPWTTVVTCLVLWQPFTADYQRWQTATSGLNHFWFAHPGLVAGVHLLWAVGVIVAVLVVGPATPVARGEAQDSLRAFLSARRRRSST